MSSNSIFGILRLSWRHAPARLRLQLVASSLLLPVATALDLIGLGLVLPITQVLQNERFLQENTYARAVSEVLGVESAIDFVKLACVLILALSLFKAAFNYFLNFYTAKFISLAEKDFVIKLYSLYLNSSITAFHARHTANIIDNIFWFSGRVFSGVIFSTQQLVGEVLLASGIICLIFLANPYAGFGGLVIVAVFGIIYRLAFSRRLEKLSQELHDSITHGNKILHESLHGIMEVKVLGTESLFVDRYGRERTTYAVRNYRINGLRLLPRAYIEISVAVGIVSFVLFSLGRISNTELVSLLALYGVSALRLMPSISRMIEILTQIRSMGPNVRTVCDEYDALSKIVLPRLAACGEGERNTVRMRERLEVDGVAYRYAGSQGNALERVSFSFRRGRSVGIVGASGAGKSTLAHVLLGLLPPQDGEIRIDGRKVDDLTIGLRRSMTFVPQHIFLVDDTIRRNIAFGVPDGEIDNVHLHKVIHLAQLEELVASLPDGVNAPVGERGVRFSGGQRQRLGIARALYFDAEIIILDEATSALDVETETKIAHVIHGLHGERTVLVIAHRLSTVARCDDVLYFDGGRLVDQGTFDELKGRNAGFARMVQLASLSPEQRIE